MAGQIGAEAREDGGSLFWFSAELPEVDGIAEAAPARQDLRGLRTLVVDDNASNRTILEHYLRNWELACESVDRPSAAIEALERASREGHPFELALLDFNMPQMNGMELIREIRKRPALDALKTVILSSGSFGQSQFDGMSVSAVLKKPARQSAIRDAIADAFAGTTPQLAPTPPKQSGAADSGLLVLIAEDNAINCTVIEALLGKLGLQTAVAHNGREAIEMAAGHDYDAIFMDCLMPEADGFEATQEIRRVENGRHVPIIAMTALSMPGDRERCLAAGMDDYLSKPIRRVALDAAVYRWLHTGPADQALND
jgi:two-component system, sensor histidine kinase and response regulator